MDIGVLSQRFSNLFVSQPHFAFYSQNDGPVYITVLCEPTTEGYATLIRTEDHDKFIHLPVPDKKKVRVLVPRVALKYLKSTLGPQIGENLRLVTHSEASRMHVTLEKKLSLSTYKIGILHCPNAEMDEDAMYSSTGSAVFFDFLTLMGEVVILQGWGNYAGGLDVTNNSTGTRSLYTKFLNLEIMFHVSTLLPLHADDPQRLERKRHLGNDIVVIVFVEKGKFNPSCLFSQFIHVLAVVSPVGVSGEVPLYRVTVLAKKAVPECYPSVLHDSVMPGDESFRLALLALIINVERTVLASVPAFHNLWKKSRMLMLSELIDNVTSEEVEKPEKSQNQAAKGHRRNLSTNFKTNEICAIPKVFGGGEGEGGAGGGGGGRPMGTGLGLGSMVDLGGRAGSPERGRGSSRRFTIFAPSRSDALIEKKQKKTFFGRKNEKRKGGSSVGERN